MKSIFILLIILSASQLCLAQNVGIGVTSPAEKLEVNGNIKSNGLMVTAGAQGDEVRKGTGDNLVFTKGHGGLGLNYIIAVMGLYPPRGGGGSGGYSDIILGEIRLFAGNFAPDGFMFCQGQLLGISSNSALFSLLGTQYGGDGRTTFALPDLRGAVPVGFGSNGTTPSWSQGEKTN
ncbi:MAG: tail fiber protein [Ginsengibacter sp.]